MRWCLALTGALMVASLAGAQRLANPDSVALAGYQRATIAGWLLPERAHPDRDSLFAAMRGLTEHIATDCLHGDLWTEPGVFLSTIPHSVGNPRNRLDWRGLAVNMLCTRNV